MNNADVIPRASICNLMVLVEFLAVVGARLEATGQSPRDLESTGAFLKLLLTQGAGGDMLLTPAEIQDGFRAASERVELRDPDHLFVAGRVLHLYDPWVKAAAETEGGDASAAARTAERLYVTDGTSQMLRYIEMEDRMIT